MKTVEDQRLDPADAARRPTGFPHGRGPAIGQRGIVPPLTVALLLATLLLAAFAGDPLAAAARTDAAAGTVYTLTNSGARNEVIAYDRAADGTLSLLDRFATGGLGSGTFENVDTMLILGSAAGQSSPVDLGGGADLLFAANAGSDEISVFRVQASGRLELVETEPSGGERPISLTVRNGVLYVLNSAGDLTGAGFCLGGAPQITGFRVNAAGQLTPIPGSTRALPGGSASGCAQVTFTPAGDVLIVSELNADKITTFTVGADGLATGPIVNDSSGVGPFGFTFDRRGRMLLTENFQAREGQGAVSSYSVGSDGRLAPIGGSVRLGETDPCWIVLTPDGRYAYASSFGPVPIVSVRSEASRRGAISSFRVGDDGALTVLDTQAALLDVGAADLALGGNGRYLYVLNSVEGTIRGFRVEADGGLTPITAVDGIPTNPFGPLSSGLAARDAQTAPAAPATATPAMPQLPRTGAGGLASQPAPRAWAPGVGLLALTLAGAAYALRRRHS